jgi:hypothetical protein
MKRLLTVVIILAGSLVASSAYSQVRFHGGFRFPVPVPRVHIYAQPIVPPVVYAPAPYYGGYVNEGVAIGPRYGYGYGYDRFPRGRVFVERRGFNRRFRRW